MSDNPPVTTRRRATLYATKLGASPSLASFDDESIQLNQQGPYGILDQKEESCTSQFSNPTFDPSTLIDTFQIIALM